MTETQNPKWSYHVTYVTGTSETFPSNDDHPVPSKVVDHCYAFTDANGDQTHVRIDAIVKIQRLPYSDGGFVMTSSYLRQ